MQRKGNLLPKGGNPESLPGRGSLILPSLLLDPTGKTHLCAAKATAVETKVLRVSFPPKPPPILFTRTTIRFAGTPNMFATKLCVWGKKTRALNASFGLTLGLTQSLPNMHRPNYRCEF